MENKVVHLFHALEAVFLDKNRRRRIAPVTDCEPLTQVVRMAGPYFYCIILYPQ